MRGTIEKLWTVADYQALPEGPPFYQLIEGQLLTEGFPTRYHQDISRNLQFALLKYLEVHPVGRLYAASFGIYLDDINVFGPDIVVILNERLHILTDSGADGAPDFVVEILSPSTWRRDLGAKKDVYAKSGVRDYWVIDPRAKRVDAYRPANGMEEPALSWRRTDILTSPLLPGFSVDAATVFAD